MLVTITTDTGTASYNSDDPGLFQALEILMDLGISFTAESSPL